MLSTLKSQVWKGVAANNQKFYKLEAWVSHPRNEDMICRTGR